MSFRFLKTGKFLEDQVSLYSRELFEAISSVVWLIVFLVARLSLLQIVILEYSLLEEPAIFEELDKFA